MALVAPTVASIGSSSCHQDLSSLYLYSSSPPLCIPPTIVPLYSLFHAVDAITCKFGVCHVSIDTCLRLPFSALIEHRLPPFHSLAHVFRSPSDVLERCPGVLELSGNDVLTFDPETQVLQVRSSVDGLPHPTNSRRAIQLLQSQQLLLTNFIHFNIMPLVPRPTIHNIDITPITSYSESISHVSTLLLSLLASSFSFESHYFLLSSPSTNGYEYLPLLTNPSSSSSPLGTVKWKQFWALQIPLNARNTWFRILHGKVTTRQLLHTQPKDQLSPYCPHCRSSSSSSTPIVEDIEHFLFTCPVKLEVWRHTLSLCLSPHFAHFTYEEYRAIAQLRLDIDRSTHDLFLDLSVFQVFACIQQAIWFAHYRQVFQRSPFIPSTIIYSIHRTLTNLDSQLNFDTVI